MHEGVHSVVFWLISLLSFFDCKAKDKAQVAVKETELWYHMDWSLHPFSCKPNWLSWGSKEASCPVRLRLAQESPGREFLVPCPSVQVRLTLGCWVLVSCYKFLSCHLCPFKFRFSWETLVWGSILWVPNFIQPLLPHLQSTDQENYLRHYIRGWTSLLTAVLFLILKLFPSLPLPSAT